MSPIKRQTTPKEFFYMQHPPIWLKGGYLLIRAYIYADLKYEHIILLYYSDKLKTYRRYFCINDHNFNVITYPGDYFISPEGLIGSMPTKRELPNP